MGKKSKVGVMIRMLDNPGFHPHSGRLYKNPAFS